MPQNDVTQAQNVRRLVVALVNAVIFDLPLLPTMRVDFGLSTDDHLQALHDAITLAMNTKPEPMETIYAELTAALGDGEKITAFVRKYAPWHAEITFLCAAQQPPIVRPLVSSLLQVFVLDLPLTPGMCVDFGLSTDDHRDALYDAIDAAFDKLAVLEPIAAELDEALGDGEKITAFVRKYAPWHAEITFSAQPLNP